MPFPQKNYTYGRYKVYFDPFVPGTKTKTGQRYFGNTPELSMTSESETLDHFDADNGVRTKDDSMLLELNRTGAFVTDHISPDNLAAFFLGEAGKTTQTSATGQTYSLTAVKQGRAYQIGSDAGAPMGVRGITNVSVEPGGGGTPFVVDDDYVVDLTTGRITIVEGGGIADDDDIDITYDRSATSWNRVVSGDNAEIYGALYFESTNPKGAKQDFYLPYCLIRPDGDFELKGDEWQQLPFSFEALKLDDNTNVIYINGRPGENI